MGATAAVAQTNGNAAVVPAATPATATSGSVAPAAGEAGDGKVLADLLDELPEPATDAEAGAGAEGAAESSPEAAEKPREQPARTDDEAAIEAATDEKLFTAEALSTPDGVKRASEVLRTARGALTRRSGMLDRFDFRLNKRAKQLNAEKQKFDQEVAPARQAATRAVECFRVLDPNSGATAKQRLAAIGVLACGDPSRGQDYYEEWSLGIAADGKAQPAPVDREARERLARLERERQEQAERDKQAQAEQEHQRLTGGIEKKKAEILEVARNAEAYPTLAEQLETDPEVAPEVADYATALMVDYHERTGRLLAKEKALAIIEERLAKRVGARAGRAGQSPERGSGEPTKTPRSPTSAVGKGKTVLPSSADRTTGIVREPTSLEERTRANARDPELMDAIFGGRWREERDE